MSLQFIIGRAGTGKTTLIMDMLAEKISGRKEKHNCIFLVPDQMTLQTETVFFEREEIAGLLDAQIFSFNRLAWRILQESGGLARTFLTDSGLEMVIRKIMIEKEEELQLFGRNASKRGFIKELELVFKEMKQFCVEQEQLQGFDSQASADLNNKMADIAVLYEAYERVLAGKYLENEDYLRLLADAILSSGFLAESEIFIDGFHEFSPQEYLILGEILSVCKNVTITLTLDKAYSMNTLQAYNLFQLTGTTYAKLKEIAQNKACDVLPDITLKENTRFRNSDLAYLQASWGEFSVTPFEGATPSLSVDEANNRRAEIEGVARRVRALVAEGYRYRDMAILLRNTEVYETILKASLSANDIPYFIDKKRTMANHPMVEFLRSSLDVIRTNWQYEAIFQAVRTEFFFPLDVSSSAYRGKVDIFENYILENGIYNKRRWMDKRPWGYRKIRGLDLNQGVQTDDEKTKEATINEVREQIKAPLLILETRLKAANNGVELASALFEFMLDVQVDRRLDMWRKRAEEMDELELAKEHEQAWKSVIALLDEFVEVMGDEELSLDIFFDIINTGLDALDFALLPPSLDQLIITDMDSSRLLNMKIIFAVGINDGVLPMKKTESGILSDEDREYLNQSGIAVRPSGKSMLSSEDFLAYRLFTLPSEHLFISFPNADENGKELSESNYIRRIETIFPEVKRGLYLSDPSLLSDSEQASYVSTPKSAIALLTAQMQYKKKGYPMSQVWWDVYTFFQTDVEWRSRALQILESLFYQNKAKNISEEVATTLFGENIHASVSRMERFYSCHFQHFAQHGLKLEERAHFKLQSVDIGEIFHGAMEWISAKLRENNLEWGQLSVEQCMELATLAMKYLAPKLQHEILLSTKRLEYIQYKLLNIIIRATRVLNEQAKISRFKPVGLEVDFGVKGEIPPLKLPLNGGRELILQGRIDRIDEAEQDERTFLRIIDYKSSSHDLPMTEVYYGLALQMLTYLDIVVENSAKLIGKVTEPAGVLYFHMHNPLINADKELTETELEKELLKSFRMKGLVLDDALAVSLMDTELEAGKTSSVIPTGLKKDGNFNAHSATATRAEFETMREYVRHQYTKAGNKIIDGEVAINPYKLKERTPCQLCAFRSVCQFDASLENNQYRKLENQSREDILRKMREEGQE
ncbi:helicase-exonuclease AddAB subunit AddB [Listeria rustica]|uniref:ATP-dependent helicase/deoxyribonuclease subunit B n=1 Tax=Listeria rustica TaxID=2713503 RepID=A0A7W1T995_9LIST|nr:helicase-exonuclease AddAB subunit AddB [Listeria rustica]MBA3927868.1 helicase-exonuclease AddAB subunit AddB [Listeria rustica]